MENECKVVYPQTLIIQFSLHNGRLLSDYENGISLQVVLFRFDPVISGLIQYGVFLYRATYLLKSVRGVCV